MKTALVKNAEGNHEVIRKDCYRTNKEFATDLRGNGYKVVKVWDGDVSDDAASDWFVENRKGKNEGITVTRESEMREEQDPVQVAEKNA